MLGNTRKDLGVLNCYLLVKVPGISGDTQTRIPCLLDVVLHSIVIFLCGGRAGAPRLGL